MISQYNDISVTAITVLKKNVIVLAESIKYQEHGVEIWNSAIEFEESLWHSM